MIHLDANFLIDSLKQSSRAAGLLHLWLENGETLATSSVAWAQFANGPIRASQFQRVEYLIEGNVLAFTRYEAELSARLFNQTGRRRSSQADCFIAATAITAGAPLATEDRRDFQLFVPAGLQLAEVG